MKLPHVRSADDIIDMLFKAASRTQSGGKDPVAKIKARSIRKLHAISGAADREFSSYITGFPSFEKNKFEWEIADLLVGADKLKLSIGKVHGTKNMIVTITNRIARDIAKSGSVSRIHQLRDSAYGRVSSIIHAADGDIEFLRTASVKLREVPDLQTGNSVVIAGYPNVGKSMLISRLSNARTRVESYPFTTTTLIVGHRMVGWKKVQFVDCPGLTERAFETRNLYERKAIAAIRHLADVLVYLVDASETCGYSIEQQTELFHRIMDEFSPAHPLLVYSKADVKRPEQGLAVSSVTGEGLEELLKALDALLVGKKTGSESWLSKRETSG